MRQINKQAAPVTPFERIVALDVLRGFALLGILIMNIQGFSMPVAAYFNPTVYGDLTGPNRWVWMLSHVLTDQKFMTIFALLFGAGIILLTSRLEKRGQSAWKIHYRRTFWLLLVGLAHAYLLWSGDILVLYALCALVVFWFRKLSPRRLVSVGIVSLAIPPTLVWFGGATMNYWPPEIHERVQAEWQPDGVVIQAEVEAYRGDWLAQMDVRVPESLEMNTYGLVFMGFWRAGGLMLIGMALYKWGVLTARRSRRLYAAMTLASLPAGLTIVAYGVQQNFAHNWAMAFSRFGPGIQFNYWGRK